MATLFGKGSEGAGLMAAIPWGSGGGLVHDVATGALHVQQAFSRYASGSRPQANNGAPPSASPPR